MISFNIKFLVLIGKMVNVLTSSYAIEDAQADVMFGYQSNVLNVLSVVFSRHLNCILQNSDFLIS